MRHALAALGFLGAVIAAPEADALLCTPFLGCTCAVTASDITFGEFTPLQGTQDAVGQIEVDCTGVIDVAPSVTTSLDDGQWGTYAPRKMRSASGELLNYNLYTTTQRNVVWGNGTGGSVTVGINGGLLSLGNWSASRTMFARAAPTTATKPGAYSDTVVVRIVW